MTERHTLDISWGTIGKIALATLSLYLLFLLKDIVIWTVFGAVIAVMFDPLIDALHRLKIPRVIGAVVTYVLVFGLAGMFLYNLAPFFASEIQRFSQLLPHYLETLAPVLSRLGVEMFSDVQGFINVVAGNVSEAGKSLFNAVATLFGGLFAAVFIVSVAIFISLEDRSIERAILLLFPKRMETFALGLWERAQKKVSGWFLSRLLASLFVGLATYVVLVLFNVGYPLSLGILSGISNIIPIVGPLLVGSVIGGIVALESATKALLVLVALVLIQQIENNIVTPMITKKLVGMSPVLVLISMAAGGQLWGIMGAIFTLPLAAVLFEFLQDILKKQKE
ncbi:MAG: AI-2E family transporter [Candidatus Wildermuthbacteria bacterium]|nr:AI-2E family transporter [Candidatus Wildermuthbacteria bacterium]